MAYAEQQMAEVKRKKDRHTELADIAVDDAAKAAEIRAEAEGVLSITDDILDEIESVLMDQETVNQYRQAGGQ